ncbi:hypothetical protein [Microbacterium rhizophilus]|uniref:hypothetical protein n=1 Tax=Microbacterium rhizophilus TaxID=3138934 RepID=UPI0031E6A2AF
MKLTARRAPWVAAVGAFAGTAILAGAVTYALWSAAAPFATGSITAGDLDLTVGEATWRQTTPGVASPASGGLGETPADFLSMPGDEVEIRIPVTTELTGDNLVGALTVGFADAGVVTDGVTATFHVEDGHGAQVAPLSGDVPLGGAASPDRLVGSDAGVTSEWVLVVSVEVGGDYVWMAPDAEQPDEAGQWTVGDLSVRLEQVRAGDGLADRGGA